MLEIYKVFPIIQNLPLQIECLCAYDEYLIAGTKQGLLLMYKLESVKTTTGELKFDVQLLRSNKSFAKKPIVQIEVVPELRILVSLSDNLITVHNLDQMTFPTITCLSKTKGATLFVLDVQKPRGKEQQCFLRMCVAVRHRLMFFVWKNNDFHEWVPDLKVPDTPKMIALCDQSLCVGLKTEYSLIKLPEETKELFPTGKQPEPLIVLLEGNRLALGRDEKTYIFDNEGSPILNYPISWSNIPINLVNDPPYLVAILPSNIIEILTIEPKLFIQKIDLSSMVKSKAIQTVKCLNKKGHIFVHSSTDIVCLIQVPVNHQIDQLQSKRHFELALQLSKQITEDREQVEKRIQNLHAFDLFCNKQYKEALSLFLTLKTSPLHVIGLFPDLLPIKLCESLEYPSKPPVLQGADLETGLFALTEYLVEVRRNLSAFAIASSEQFSDDKTSPEARLNQLSQIIDTTLLKCYIQTNDALVASLLRLDNRCHFEETEQALKKHHKYNELIILYQNKGKHKQALELLHKQSKKPNSPFAGYERTVQYLQHLGKEDLNLIFEYAAWVLKEYPEEGIKIFIEDTAAEMEHLPRQLVIDYLQKINPDLIIPYLEHVIYIWNDTIPSFHNTLVHKYREKVKILLNEHKNSLPESDQQHVSAGQEPGELGIYRKKLIEFLEFSDYYSTETLPTYLFNDGLFEERAVVMGKINNHKDALTIYVHILHDLKKAEEYCEKMYSKKNSKNKDVFLVLLDIYLSVPPQPSTSSHESHIDSNSTTTNSNSNSTTNIQAALDLLKNHSTKIDPLKAINLLPCSVPVSLLKQFLQSMAYHLLVERHGGQIFKNLLLAQHLQVNNQRIRLQQLNKIVIDEHDLCRVCQKRIAKSVFLRFPNKDLVHLMCKDKYNSR